MEARLILNEIRRSVDSLGGIDAGRANFLKGWYILTERYPKFFNDSLDTMDKKVNEMIATLTSERQRELFQDVIDVTEYYCDANMPDFRYFFTDVADRIEKFSYDEQEAIEYAMNMLDEWPERVIINDEQDNGNRVTFSVQTTYNKELNMGRWYVHNVHKLQQVGLFIRFK